MTMTNSSQTNRSIHRVAVLGAGVMGAQIAAHCINAKVPVLLFDLPNSKPELGNKNAIAIKAIETLKKLKPAPLGNSDQASLIEPANYDDDLDRLRECDLVIEAIAERMDWKHELYQKVSPYIRTDAIFATNTSGLSITELSKGFSPELKQRFCGVHFFNPPRYMHLLELIPTASTASDVLDTLETFMTSTLGKGVIRAKDTPNFIANRIGVFSILAVFTEAEKYKLGFDEVDAMTGSKLGRAKSATFRTSDVVGLDTMAHVMKTMENNLQHDPFSKIFKVPKVVETLISMGNLGQKSKAGFYKKQGKEILVFNGSDYVPSTGQIDSVVERILKKPIQERLALLRAESHPQAQFLWAIFRDIFHYIALHLDTIAESARDIDFAMRWGFGWHKGPFEDWQAAGWSQVANWVKEDIDTGKALCSTPLPNWVFEGPIASSQQVHTTEGSWSAASKRFVGQSSLAVYNKQVFRANVTGELAPSPLTAGNTLFENEGARVWSETSTPDVLIISFKSKMNSIGPDVMEAMVNAIELAEASYRGLVVWQPTSLKQGAPGGPFSAGANLEAAMPLFMKHGAKGIEPFVKSFQETMMRVKYAQVPVVCAISGIALGGGCELSLHAAKRVAAIESYIGLVEVGIGLLPAGGGLKEAAARAANGLKLSGGTNYVDFAKQPFEQAAMAKVSSSAHEALAMGYLKEDDILVANVHELLYHAQQAVIAMSIAGYRPPLKTMIPVGGRSLISTVMGQVINLRDGNFISEHDAFIAKRIIEVIAGGDVEAGTLVSEEWLLKLERQAFVELLGMAKTQERVMGLLQTGKPVRN